MEERYAQQIFAWIGQQVQSSAEGGARVYCSRRVGGRVTRREPQVDPDVRRHPDPRRVVVACGEPADPGLEQPGVHLTRAASAQQQQPRRVGPLPEQQDARVGDAVLADQRRRGSREALAQRAQEVY